jgi:hypothetical protein
MKHPILPILILGALPHSLTGEVLRNDGAPTFRECQFSMPLCADLRHDLRTGATAQKDAELSEEEEDKLREEQDPGARIELYLEYAQDRLNQFDQFRQKPADPKYDTGGYLDKLLGQYVALEDELKNWIQYQYDHQGDLRKGLRTLLDRGPRQLEQLRHIQQEPDAFASAYRNGLRDAIDNLTDTLDGATTALSNQEKKFGQMKKQEKIDEQQAKQEAKEEKKRIKEEEKLRKKERKQQRVPEDVDEN